MIGLEVGISVAAVGIRGEATGCPSHFLSDVVATAKRDLAVGEMLDGEGGYTVYGHLYPAEKSLALGGLPLGLAHNIKLLRPIAAGRPVTWADVQIDTSLPAYRVRREMEQMFSPQRLAAE